MSGRLSSSAVRAVLILFGYAAMGLLGALLWEWWWTPPRGVVLNQTWYLDQVGAAEQFSGTADYVVIAVIIAIVLGFCCGQLPHGRELLTVGLVVVGSALAAWLMARVGHALGPADPQQLARGEPDLTEFPGELRLPGWSPMLAWPIASLSALVVSYLGSRGRSNQGGRSRETGFTFEPAD